VIILDTLLIGGIKFVLRRIAEAVDAEMNDVDALRQELLAAQMRLELGEITEAQFATLEREVLARIREIRARMEEESGASGPMRITGIDVSAADDVEGGR
jgi:23S rRNA maturation-related 3'-5' exoribonuclease YhaM